MARKRTSFILGLVTVPAALLLVMGGQALVAAVGDPAIVHTKAGISCPATGNNETQSIGLHSDFQSASAAPSPRTPVAAIAEGITQLLPNVNAAGFRLARESAGRAEYVLKSPSGDVIARARLLTQPDGGWVMSDVIACAVLSREA